MKPTEAWLKIFGKFYIPFGVILGLILGLLVFIGTAVFFIVSVVLFFPSLGHSWKIIMGFCHVIYEKNGEVSNFSKFMNRLLLIDIPPTNTKIGWIG